MKTDRELLELAAKAVGYDTSHKWNSQRIDMDPPVIALCIPGVSTGWNPLADDGDAFRLAANLKLHILHNEKKEDVLWVSAVLNKTLSHGSAEFLSESDRQESMRLAIVRAAAAIGESMQ